VETIKRQKVQSKIQKIKFKQEKKGKKEKRKLPTFFRELKLTGTKRNEK